LRINFLVVSLYSSSPHYFTKAFHKTPTFKAMLKTLRGVNTNEQGKLISSLWVVPTMCNSQQSIVTT